MIQHLEFAKTIDVGLNELQVERVAGSEELTIYTGSFRLVIPMTALGTFMSALAKVSHGSKSEAALEIDSASVIQIGRSEDRATIWIGEEPFYMRLPHDVADQVLAAISMANKQWIDGRARAIAAERERAGEARPC